MMAADSLCIGPDNSDGDIHEWKESGFTGAVAGGYAAIDCTAGLPGSNSIVTYQDPITAIGQSINVTSVKFILT